MSDFNASKLAYSDWPGVVSLTGVSTYSNRKVLPALVPQLSYNSLNINQGGDASLAFESLYYELDKTNQERLT